MLHASDGWYRGSSRGAYNLTSCASRGGECVTTKSQMLLPDTYFSGTCARNTRYGACCCFVLYGGVVALFVTGGVFFALLFRAQDECDTVRGLLVLLRLSVCLACVTLVCRVGQA